MKTMRDRFEILTFHFRNTRFAEVTQYIAALFAGFFS